MTGSDFPPNTGASLTANGVAVGAISTGASGVFTATLSTGAASEGMYYLTAHVGAPGMLSPADSPDLQSTALFSLQAGGDLHPQEGSYTVFSVPAGSAVTEARYLPILTR